MNGGSDESAEPRQGETLATLLKAYHEKMEATVLGPLFDQVNALTKSVNSLGNDKETLQARIKSLESEVQALLDLVSAMEEPST